MARKRTTAFLAAFLMLFSIVMVAPAAHAKEKETKASTGPVAPVTKKKSTPATSTKAKTDDVVDTSRTGGQPAEPSAQKPPTPAPSRGSIRAASDSSTTIKKASSSGGATSKTSNGPKSSSTTTSLSSPGNPNAGCYPLPASSDTGHGANKRGVYDSTCDGSPSQNGSGVGAAVGRPCAGCVGKADYKNPPGQMPNGAQDGNRGYECDNNQGIGKTNPAHTGCKTGVAPPTDTNKPPVVKQPPTTGPPQGKPPVEQPPKVVPDIEVRPSVPDKVLPLPRIEREVVRPAAELQPVPLQVSPAGVAPLPFTGSADPWLFLIFGFGLIGAGWMTLLSLPIRSRKMRFI